MPYQFLADTVVIVHAAFVVFVVLGAFLVLFWKKVAFFHLPSVAWAAFIEFSGRICPLTPLENLFREKGGAPVYADGFIEHYIIPVLYPEILTRQLQIIFGVLVIIINLTVYGSVYFRFRLNRKIAKGKLIND